MEAFLKAKPFRIQGFRVEIGVWSWSSKDTRAVASTLAAAATARLYLTSALNPTFHSHIHTHTQTYEKKSPKELHKISVQYHLSFLKFHHQSSTWPKCKYKLDTNTRKRLGVLLSQCKRSSLSLLSRAASRAQRWSSILKVNDHTRIMQKHVKN